ncbi:MAG: DivIVA domain-containing protein [Actinobacteria bacterium]|nr:DivIVA domain-containing protein [Actinomycetota bacterium]
MALTPEDVRNKQFTTVRFKEGYDLDEVDNFLDEIEESLSAVTREVEDLRATAKGEVPESIREEIRSLGDENARLKSELDQAAKALQDSDARVVVSDDTAASDEALKNSQARVNELELQLSNSQSELAASLAAVTGLKDQLAAAQSEGVAAAATAAATASPAEQGLASVRILELAQRTADEAVASARIESEQLLGAAKSTSEELVSQAKARRVEELRAYEREYRGRLRSYLEGQLRELESKNIGGDRQVTED